MKVFSQIILFLFFFAATANLNAQDTICSNTADIEIISYQSGQPIGKVTLKIYKGLDEYVKTVTTDTEGKAHIEGLDCDTKYLIKVIKENYLEDTKLIFTTNTPNENHQLKSTLISHKEFDITADGQKNIIADYIQFYPDTFELDPDSVKELRRILKILKKYDDMRIEIGFFTDSRGGEEYLKQLTQKRAEVCKSFFVDHGIDSDRIIAVGYGGSRPVNHCKKGVKCTEKEHRVNHRSVFKVLNYSGK